MRKIKFVVLALSLLVSCAGTQRSCSNSCATQLGADWLIVQRRADGQPIACWTLQNTSVTNEGASDGIYWEAPSGNLVHISGWYERVQVDGDWNAAYRELNITEAQCQMLKTK